MPVQLAIPSLGNKFQDYRDPIPGDSYNWGPVINANNIRYFTFHHSVTPQTAKVDGNWKAEANKIANLHLAQGWGGIGYRFVICSDGTVAYVGDLSHGGSAVADHNDEMFSAVLVGDFTRELPTAAQVHSAHLLAKHFLTAMPQYPNLERWDQIKGHKDFNSTMCPGPNWTTGGDTLRDRIVNDRYQGYPNPQPVASTPPAPPAPTELAVAKQKIVDLETANALLRSHVEDLKIKLDAAADYKAALIQIKEVVSNAAI